MTTAVAGKFSTLSTKLQVSTAAVAVAAAAAITPAVAHSAPSIVPFSASGLGSSVVGGVDSVVILPGSNKNAAASATPTPGQIIFGGYGQSLNQAIGATVFAVGFGVGTIVAITGNVISLLLPAVGAPISAFGNGIIASSFTYAQDHGIGPYGT